MSKSKKKKPTAKRSKLPPVGTQWRHRVGQDPTRWEMTKNGLVYHSRSVMSVAELDDPKGKFVRVASAYRKPEPERLRHETTSTAAGWLPKPGPPPENSDPIWPWCYVPCGSRLEPKPAPESQIDRVLRMMDDLTRRVQALEGGKR